MPLKDLCFIWLGALWSCTSMPKFSNDPAVSIYILICPEDGGSKFLENVNYLPNYTLQNVIFTCIAVRISGISHSKNLQFLVPDTKSVFAVTKVTITLLIFGIVSWWQTRPLACGSATVARLPGSIIGMCVALTARSFTGPSVTLCCASGRWTASKFIHSATSWLTIRISLICTLRFVVLIVVTTPTELSYTDDVSL
jgi:hypothetical protein